MVMNKENSNSHYDDDQANNPLSGERPIVEKESVSKDNIQSQIIRDPRKPKSTFEKPVA